MRWRNSQRSRAGSHWVLYRRIERPGVSRAFFMYKPNRSAHHRPGAYVSSLPDSSIPPGRSFGYVAVRHNRLAPGEAALHRIAILDSHIVNRQPQPQGLLRAEPIPNPPRASNTLVSYHWATEVMTMAEIKVDCMGQNCPVPLVETRKALRKAVEGDVVEVTGTHPPSKKEIPMAARAMGLQSASRGEIL
jgi:tRNA 2-thiouridine synthesizing protein A